MPYESELVGTTLDADSETGPLQRKLVHSKNATPELRYIADRPVISQTGDQPELPTLYRLTQKASFPTTVTQETINQLDDLYSVQDTLLRKATKRRNYQGLNHMNRIH